ncbi:urease accessory protein D-like [Rhododendron vialii]|uniref:urease accessory protein D-like n=1 Tax=Rhododendron vialii TaxID=182163 RepID=UPI00265E3D48|nr:urease accessory protein D-like [Rhododendron vialii]
METGKVVVERIGGKSTITRYYSKYPLKFIIPTKVGSSQTDVVWIYSLTYGGGIVSIYSISSDLTIGDGGTTVLTTQASTNVYKSLQSKFCEQVLEVSIP